MRDPSHRPSDRAGSAGEYDQPRDRRGEHSALTGNTATATLNVAASQVSFLIRYAANLNVGESVVNFTNTGESSTFSFGGNLAQNGEICANVFAYSRMSSW